MISILIAGDFAPTNRVASILEKGRYSDVFGEVKSIAEQVDYSLVNLESPIVNNGGTPLKKAGPNLKCRPSAIQAIHYIGFKGVTLANNHFYDYGEDGALTTINLLAQSYIDYVGAGRNLLEASNILYKTIKGKVFAFINCCENEYSIATSETAGSNPISPVRQYYSIKEAREKADYVIVIVHGGIEGYQLPTPRMQEWYRFFIDCGTDVVVNHHQHCYSGYEEYNGKRIFYGLGNFCFDRNMNQPDSWYEGYLLKLFFNDGEIDFEMIPYIQCKEEARIIIQNQSDGFDREIKRLNDVICDAEEIHNAYVHFMDATMNSQKYVLSPYKNKYLSALYVRGFLPGFLPLVRWRNLQNKIICESHRDRFIYFLNSKLK